MGKKTALLLALAACCMGFASCGREENTEPPAETNTSAESTVQTETTPVTETQKPSASTATTLTAAERAAQFAGKTDAHVSDETGTLSADALSALDKNAAEIASRAAIKMAAVITDHLGGLSPDAFAAEYYNALCGSGSSGFLILVNNDTGEDRVYTSGACHHYLPQEEIDLTIAKVSPQLVTGDYAPALEQLFALGNLMPDTIYDHSGILSREQYAHFCELADAALKNTDQQYSVLLVDTRTWQTAVSLQSYADAQRQALEDQGLLVIDVEGKICAVSSDISGAATMTAELNAVLHDAASLPITAAVTEYYKQIKALH